MFEDQHLDRIVVYPFRILRDLRHRDTDRGLCRSLVETDRRQNEEPDLTIGGGAQRNLHLSVGGFTHFVDQPDDPTRASAIQFFHRGRPFRGKGLPQGRLAVSVDALHHIADQTDHDLASQRGF
ncbi:hypothetical protein D3C71_1287100 [compost metagenome]